MTTKREELRPCLANFLDENALNGDNFEIDLGTLAESVPGSYLSKTYPDEPLFVLRANDPLAPRIVEEWATLAEMRGVPAEKVAEALRLRDAMCVWQADHGHGKTMPN